MEDSIQNRPWGNYEILRDEDHFKVKTITIASGQRLSYQSHEKREEHWVIVAGQGVFTLNDEEKTIKVSDHVFIPKKAKHRIHNLSDDPLVFVEVQTGEYFGEDDIVRYADDYGRGNDAK